MDDERCERTALAFASLASLDYRSDPPLLLCRGVGHSLGAAPSSYPNPHAGPHANANRYHTRADLSHAVAYTSSHGYGAFTGDFTHLDGGGGGHFDPFSYPLAARYLYSHAHPFTYADPYPYGYVNIYPFAQPDAHRDPKPHPNVNGHPDGHSDPDGFADAFAYTHCNAYPRHTYSYANALTLENSYGL